VLLTRSSPSIFVSLGTSLLPPYLPSPSYEPLPSLLPPYSTLLTGPQIAHKTLAFLGFGRISHSVLLRLLPFSPSPRVIYHTRTRPSSSELSSLSQGFSTAAGPGRKIEVEWVDLETLAKEGDIVLVLCAGGDATRGLVGEDFMRKMGQGKSKGQGVIVNAARGSIVDSDALAKALKEGWIMGAGLDVVDGEPNVGKEHPLVRESRCVVLPHLGSATAETREGMAMLAAENLVRGVKGEEMRVELKE
jgi:glyoxylate/hydroxypyruvate reductase